MQAVYFVTITGLLLLVALLGLYTTRKLNSLRRQLSQAEQARHKAEQQLQAALHVSRQFAEAHAEAHAEGAIIDTLLNLAMQLTGAMGASFVPLDENNRPAASVRRGDFPFPVPDAWLEYLASPVVRQTCQQCKVLENHDHTCALLRGPFSDALGLHCFPLRLADTDLGMLNLYLPAPGIFEQSDRLFLASVVDMTALALEGERLRRRGLETFSQLHLSRQKASRSKDLAAALSTSLDNLRRTLGADFVILALKHADSASAWDEALSAQNLTTAGDISPQALVFLKDRLRRSPVDGEPVLQNLSDVTAPLRAWLAVPLPFNASLDSQRGLLLLGSSRSAVLQSGRVALVQAVSEHIAMLLQSADQMAEMEYKVMMEERTRLAREIHDGLAQTLGFLKLQMAQMLNVLERPTSLDVGRLRKLAHSSYAALASAYTDARQAIDGLRITPGPLDQRADGYRLETWLRQTVAEYAEQAFVVHLDELDVPEILPPEVHAQLIRIVQEALSNIRKHAQATEVWISCLQRGRDVILEVRDDGQGFTPDDIPQLSRYGLRGMRERAELLGADFQVISRPGKGATVRLRLPLQFEANNTVPGSSLRSMEGGEGEEV